MSGARAVGKRALWKREILENLQMINNSLVSVATRRESWVEVVSQGV